MTRRLVVLLLLGTAACHAAPLSPLSPERLQRSGNVRRFGAGVAGMSADGRHVRMVLEAPAWVLFYNAHPDGWAELLASERISNGGRTVIIPLARETGHATLDGIRVPLCGDGGGATDAERLANAWACAHAQRDADDRISEVQRRERSPRAAYRDELVVIVWPADQDPAVVLAENAGQVQLFGGDRAGELLPLAVFRRRVDWASYAVVN